MASFKVLNAEGQAIAIDDLDKEACELWGVEYRDKDYATPFIKKPFTNPDNLEGVALTRAKLIYEMDAPSLNWFDMIGAKIAYSWYKAVTWSEIKTEIISGCAYHFFNGSSELVATCGDGDDKRLPDELNFKLACYVEFTRPFINLIDHWNKKGYIPVKL